MSSTFCQGFILLVAPANKQPASDLRPLSFNDPTFFRLNF